MTDNNELTDEQIKTYKEEIEQMTRFEMARLWRFAPVGHPFFDNSLPLSDIFNARFFDELGGFSPKISKALGH